MSASPSNILGDSPPGFWEWDLSLQTLHNPVLLQSLGYGDDNGPKPCKFWKEVIHADDWEEMVLAIEDYILQKPSRPFVQEIRLFHVQGWQMCVLIVGKITETDSDGSARKMVGSHVDLTSRKNNESSLVRIKKLLDESSRTAKLGGWEYEMESDVLNWTDSTKEIFEVDKHFCPKKGDITALFVAEQDREKVQIAFSAAVSNGASFDLDFPITTARGNSKWIRCTCQPTFQANKCLRLSGVVQDITEKKKTKEALQLKEQQLSTFIKHCPVAICMLDNEMNYIAASEIWKSFFNLQGGEITGKNQLEIFPETTAKWRDRYKAALAGEILKMDEESYVLPDGKIEWLQWEIRPWQQTPDQVGGIIIYTDVISEKHAFKEALIKARDQAEQSSLLKSKFLSVMSHEMRTPLNAVIGFMNLLMKDPRPDQIENMNVLKFSAENLLLIINDVLDFSKLEAEKVELDKKEFNLHLLTKNIISSLKHEADKKQLNLILKPDHSIPECLIGDSAKIGQIIINLLNNAIKFTHQGSVNLIYTLDAKSNETLTVGFKVVDTGIGIPLEHQEHIFDMFSQADSETTRKYGGTGLGLSISKRLLELMDSQIHLVSSEKGSTFSFEIDFQMGINVAPLTEQGTIEILSEVLVGAKILIVEDNVVNILLMKKLLTQWKCDCSTAQDGSFAVEMVKNNEYDLILMDLQMPVMDGYTASRNIRILPEPKYQSIPIIALSATDRSEIEDSLHDSGINDFISKPFNPRQLKVILIQYLSKK